MKDERKTKKVLIEELADLRQRVVELEVSSTDESRQEILPQAEQKFRDLTNSERKRMEASLKMEMTRARLYFDIAGVMLLVINADQEVALINKRGCEVLGYSDKEIIGKNWFANFLPARFRAETQRTFLEIMSGDLESSENYENPVLTKHGEERLISWHNTVLVDEQGEIIGTLSSGEDVTERRQVEEVLKLERDNLVTALEVIEVGVYIVV